VRRHAPRGMPLSAAAGAALLLLFLLSFATLVPRSAAAATSRAYELVSPAEKGGAQVLPEPSIFTPISSLDGDSAAFGALDAFGGNPVSNGVSNFYRSQRTASGWRTEQLGSPLNPVFALNSLLVTAFTPDLTKYVQIGPSTPQPVAGATDHALNMFVRDFAGYHLLTPGSVENTEVFAEVQGFSQGFGHVVFQRQEALNDETPPGVGPVLYDWDAASESIKAVGRLPDGSIAPGTVSIASPRDFFTDSTQHWHPVSDDGSRIFFYTPQEVPGRQLYVRLGGTATKQVSASQRTPVDPLGPQPPTFRIATADGSAAFFTSAEKLTDDATTGPSDEGADLYRYDVATEALADLTVDGADAAGAQVEGVLGAAEDGSRVYFVAKGVLAAGAAPGADNLYVWRDDGSPAGEVKFIAGGVPNPNWSVQPATPFGEHVVGRVTPDGSHLLFESPAALTGYPNEGHFEVYLYSAATGELSCASCNPSGTPATADALAIGTADRVSMARTLTEEGARVFFSTSEALVPGDTNGVLDAYEYAAGSGEVALISSGKGPQPSRFSDASPDGRDAFFVTADRLVGIDRDEAYDGYDARIGGGIAAQNPPPAPSPCGESTCRGSGAAVPGASPPASSTLNGPPSPKPKRKKHHRKKHHHPKKRANGNRHGHR
jgi:hypothetical protein